MKAWKLSLVMLASVETNCGAVQLLLSCHKEKPHKMEVFTFHHLKHYAETLRTLDFVSCLSSQPSSGESSKE